MVVRGMKKRAPLLHLVGTWLYCNGAEKMVVRGTNERVLQQQNMVS